MQGRWFEAWVVIGICVECTTALWIPPPEQPILKVRRAFQCVVERPRDMAALVTPLGYPLESHKVVTEDGYILTLFRIPHGKNGGNTVNGGARKTVVLLQHGLVDSSAAWVISGAGRGLAFMLADAGFDVWMGNSRGSIFSREHVSLNECDNAYWEFTFDEMAEFDFPATIYHILHVTGAPQLSYVAHSQGATIAFMRWSQDKALASKISIAVMLAPVAFVRHIASRIMRFFAVFSTPKLFALLGTGEFLPTLELTTKVLGPVCNAKVRGCELLVAAFAGYNPGNLDYSRWDVYLKYSPGGSSTRNIIHWTQALKLHKEPLLQKFDYGNVCKTLLLGRTRKCNRNVYGQDRPPEYDISQFDVPLALFFGANDVLTVETDRKLLLDVLPTENIVYKEMVGEYMHLDFTWGVDAHKKVYPTVIQLLSSKRKAA